MEPTEHEHHVLLNQRMYTTGQVAQLLCVDASTLRRWRRSTPAQGPGFILLSTRVAMYPERDLEEYLESRHIRPVA